MNPVIPELDAPTRRSLAQGEGVDAELHRIGKAYVGLNAFAAMVILLLVGTATASIASLRADVAVVRDGIALIEPQVRAASGEIARLERLASTTGGPVDTSLVLGLGKNRSPRLGAELSISAQPLDGVGSTGAAQALQGLGDQVERVADDVATLRATAAPTTVANADAARSRLWVLGAATALISLVVSLHFQNRNSKTLHTLASLRFFDPLTGLLNRSGFEVECRQRLIDGDEAVMVMLDLDYFQMINEIGGLEAGDQMLCELANTLESASHEHDVIARIGSNEFAILRMPADPSGGALALELRELLRRREFTAAGTTFEMAATFGTADSRDQNGAGFDALFASCEAALFTAKARARGSGVSLTDTERSAVRDTMWSATQLPRIIHGGGLGLAFQRLVPLHGGPERCELLLRSTDPDTGAPIAPDDIVAPAERFGLIGEIDRWVVKEALRLVRDGALDSFARVSMNLSSASIGQADFGAFVLDLLDRYPNEARRIGFEVTETAVIRDTDAARRFMTQARTRGVTFAIDDFGVGSASFEELCTLPFDTVKIDGRYVDGMMHNDTDVAVIRSVISVAATLALTTVAERVESPEQARLLSDLGVDYLQGYFAHHPEVIRSPVGPPTPADALELR